MVTQRRAEIGIAIDIERSDRFCLLPHRDPLPFGSPAPSRPALASASTWGRHGSNRAPPIGVWGRTAAERHSRLMIDAKACSSWDLLKLIESSVTTYPSFKALILRVPPAGPLLLLLLLAVIGGGLSCQ